MAHKHRLLVVDDDSLNARTLSEIFTLRGYDAQEAHSGQAALEMVKQAHFSCVLSDIKMPEMNGVELLKAVKAIQPDIVFILMTAYTDGDLIMQGVREGALVTMTKPLDIERLLAQIGYVLNHQNPL
jgi:DNA-binding NtrC family response regulator